MRIVKSITTNNGIVTGVDTVAAEDIMPTVDQGAAGLSPWLVAGTVDAAQSGVWSVGVSSLPALPAGTNTIGKVDQGAPGASAWPVSLAGSVVVTGTFWQAVQPVSGTVTANQGGIWSVTVSALPALPAGANTIGKVDQGAPGASAWKVDGSAVTQPVSLASLPALPPGSASIGSINEVGRLNSILQWGAATIDTDSGTKSAGTLRVVLATDQPQLTNALLTAQSGTWTVQPGNTANTTPWLVDTELPAAAALADGAANPTAPLVGACDLAWNGSTWDRRTGIVEGTGLASAARTASASFTLTNTGARGIMIFLNVTAASGTGGLTVQINCADPVSGNLAQLNANPTAVIATGLKVYEFGLGDSGAAAGGVLQRTAGMLPRSLTIGVSHGNSTSYTYSVGYCLIP